MMFVVFVDDTEADRILVKGALEARYDWTVETCSSLSELEGILARVEENQLKRPSMALLDMQIGDDDEAGLKILTVVRAQLPDIPAVMLSFSARRTMIEESYRNGASSYVQKPADEKEFGKRLERFQDYWQKVSHLIPHPG